MWSEELNNKIKQASENHIPKYDESAWIKMEALLNKHLPLKKDGRKKLFYIFFISFFIIGATLLLNNERSRKMSYHDLKTSKEKFALDEKKLKTDSKNILNTKDPKADKNVVYLNQADKKTKAVMPNAGRKKFTNRLFVQPAQNLSTADKENRLKINKDENKKQVHEKENVKNRSLPDAETKMQDGTELNLVIQNEKIIAPTINLQEQKIKDSLVNNVGADKTNEPTSPAIHFKNKIDKKSFFSRFSFSVSAGAEVSGVGFNDLGKTKVSYGAGIGYAISNRFSIKSGLYIADKIYSSGPEDYKPTTGYWANVDLKKVDADCKVYEIPLTLFYSFKEKKHHHWFAALGSSSYLMKKEIYHFLYKNQAGNLLYRDWTLKDKNKHYFSVITLSGGYAYRLNKTFSLIAEPYAKIPIQGLGYGKVKLKSTGFMVTISATPF